MNWMVALYVFLGVFTAIVAGIFFLIGLLWVNRAIGDNLLTPFISTGKGVWWCVRQIFKFVAIMLLGFLSLIAALLGLLMIVGYMGVVGFRKAFKVARPGLRFLLRSQENVGLVFLWPLIAYNIAHLFLGYGSSRRAWHEVLQDPWQLGGVVFASLVLTIFIAAIVKNGTLRASRAYQKYAWRVMLGIIILMILVPWLWQLADNQIHSSLEPRAAIHTTGAKEQVQETNKTHTAPSDKSPSLGPFWTARSEVISKADLENGYRVTVGISGRDKFGFEVLTLNPREKAIITRLTGEISTWSYAKQRSVNVSLHGARNDYVLKNSRTEDSWNWSPNFPYGNMAAKGVMVGEMLIIAGEVGSGEEEVFQFPDGQTEVAVVNHKQAPQPLVLYYHALTNFYVGDGGACANSSGTPLIYPNKEAAYTCRDFAAELVTGWDDQGLNGDRAIFSVTVNR